MEDIEDIFEGILEHPVDENDSKGWIKKSFSKKWKKGFYVLRKYCSTEQPFIQFFDKEDNWRNQIARGTLELFSQYRVLKRNEIKGRHHVFEVSNDSDTYILAAESETVMDLWVMQLQMQTRLNPRVEGRTFRVKGSCSKPMQRIGAKDQNCLLHISKWGITLALESSRAVLAQWPLTTVRNYESMDRSEFSFEAGRRSPMGEGKYTFYTSRGEDNRIFDTIDKYASQRLNARGGASLVANSEEEMSRAYDQLRFSVLNFNTGLSEEDNSSKPRPINNQPDDDSYSHIGRSDSIGSGRLSIGSFSASMDRGDGYNNIERHSSFGSRSEGVTTFGTSGPATYDSLDHARSQINLSLKEGPGRLNRSPSGYSHISSGFGGTPDNYRKEALRTLEVSPESDTAFSDRLTSPMSSSSLANSDVSLTKNGNFTPSPLNEGAVSTSTLTENEPPPLPERSKKNCTKPGPNEEVKKEIPQIPPKSKDSIKDKEGLYVHGKTLPALGRKRSEMTDLPLNNCNYSKTNISPNFIYLNSAHSKSVEVLSTIYATVDKSKKKKNREAVEQRRRQEYEALKQRRKSRSHESLGGSPRLNSFSFTPFTFKGLAAMDSEDDFHDEDKDLGNLFISAKQPEAEKVSMALCEKLVKSRECLKVESQKINDGNSCAGVQALKKAISQSPRFGTK